MQKTEFRTRDRWLIYAFLVGPMAALSQLNVMYVLVPTACAQGTNAMLHLSTGVFLLIAFSGVLIAGRYAREFASSSGSSGSSEFLGVPRLEGTPSEGLRGTEELRGTPLWHERTRWVAKSAMTLSIGSMVLIVALELPNVILRNCQ
jgi:hypothetical protein